MVSCARAQNLFVSDASGNIYEFKPDGTRSTFATGLDSPTTCAFNSAGNLFVGSGLDIYEFTSNGTPSTFASGLTNYVTAIAFDSTGNLFAATAVYGDIYEITTNGTPSIFAAGVDEFLEGMAFNKTEDLFVSGDSMGSIIEITPGVATNTFATGSGLVEPFGLAFDSAGNLFVADYWPPGHIYEYTPDGGQSTFASGLSFPRALAFDSAGNLFVSDLVISNSTPIGANIIKIKPDGTQNIFTSGLNSPYAFAFQPIPQLQAVANGGTLEITASMPSPYFSTIIQASTNLVNWVNIYTNTPPFTFTDSTAVTGLRFYRAVLGP